MIKLKRYSKDNADIVELDGRLEDCQVEELVGFLEEMINTGSKFIILDMKDLTYISSSGLGVISAKYISLKIRGGMLILINMQSKIERVFQITKILKVIPNFASMEEALMEISSKQISP